jgi:hypothetical protein
MKGSKKCRDCKGMGSAGRLRFWHSRSFSMFQKVLVVVEGIEDVENGYDS